MSSKLKFLVRTRRKPIPSSPRPVFVLTSDNWDDYGHQVQFHLSYIDSKGNETRLGAVKILQRTSQDNEPIELAKITKLQDAFSELDEDFVSLGQEDDYYKSLNTLFGPKSGEVLDAPIV